MRRRTEHLVEKRDGRTEFLRATKLARSIHLALKSVGIDEDWRALELANVVVAGLRSRQRAELLPGELARALPTALLADAVQQVLVATGQAAAAAAYGAVAADRQRRRRSLWALGRASVPLYDTLAAVPGGLPGPLAGGLPTPPRRGTQE